MGKVSEELIREACRNERIIFSMLMRLELDKYPFYFINQIPPHTVTPVSNVGYFFLSIVF